MSMPKIIQDILHIYSNNGGTSPQAASHIPSGGDLNSFIANVEAAHHLNPSTTNTSSPSVGVGGVVLVNNSNRNKSSSTTNSSNSIHPNTSNSPSKTSPTNSSSSFSSHASSPSAAPPPPPFKSDDISLSDNDPSSLLMDDEQSSSGSRSINNNNNNPQQSSSSKMTGRPRQSSIMRSPADFSQLPSTSSEKSTSKRTVKFPSHSDVTGYMEAPTPVHMSTHLKDTPLNLHEVLQAYVTSSRQHKLTPSTKIEKQISVWHMKRNDRQEILSLKGEKIKQANMEVLEEIFKRVRFITLDFEYCFLDDEALVALSDMMEYYDSCLRLNLSFNQHIGLRGWQALFKSLRKSPCLEQLNLRYTSLSDKSIPLLARALRADSALRILHLENCSVSGRSMLLLACALKGNGTLQELYLAENNLNSNDAAHIYQIIAGNSSLHLIDLRNNNLTDAGLSHVCDGLRSVGCKENSQLTTLVLWNNRLTSHGMKHIARALHENKTLQTLNIGCNHIGSDGVSYAKDSLARNRTLLRLGLQATKLNCQGAITVAECIADNPTLIRVDLRDNPDIKSAGLLALHLALKMNTSITTLNLDKSVCTSTSNTKDYIDQFRKLYEEIQEFCDRNRALYEVRLLEEFERQRKEAELAQQNDENIPEHDEQEEEEKPPAVPTSDPPEEEEEEDEEDEDGENNNQNQNSTNQNNNTNNNDSQDDVQEQPGADNDGPGSSSTSSPPVSRLRREASLTCADIISREDIEKRRKEMELIKEEAVGTANAVTEEEMGTSVTNPLTTTLTEDSAGCTPPRADDTSAAAGTGLSVQVQATSLGTKVVTVTQPKIVSPTGKSRFKVQPVSRKAADTSGSSSGNDRKKTKSSTPPSPSPSPNSMSPSRCVVRETAVDVESAVRSVIDDLVTFCVYEVGDHPYTPSVPKSRASLLADFERASASGSSKCRHHSSKSSSSPGNTFDSAPSRRTTAGISSAASITTQKTEITHPGDITNLVNNMLSFAADPQNDKHDGARCWPQAPLLSTDPSTSSAGLTSPSLSSTTTLRQSEADALHSASAVPSYISNSSNRTTTNHSSKGKESHNNAISGQQQQEEGRPTKKANNHLVPTTIQQGTESDGEINIVVNLVMRELIRDTLRMEREDIRGNQSLRNNRKKMLQKKLGQKKKR